VLTYISLCLFVGVSTSHLLTPMSMTLLLKAGSSNNTACLKWMCRLWNLDYRELPVSLGNSYTQCQWHCQILLSWKQLYVTMPVVLSCQFVLGSLRIDRSSVLAAHDTAIISFNPSYQHLDRMSAVSCRCYK